MDLDRITYVLLKHRGKPKSAPVFVYAILTAEDFGTLRKSTPLTPPTDATDEIKTQWVEDLSRATVAVGLREVRGLRKGGQELAYPATEALVARVAWIKQHIPYLWTHELSRAIQEEAEFDPEAE